MSRIRWEVRPKNVGPSVLVAFLGTMRVGSVQLSTNANRYTWRVGLPGLKDKYASGVNVSEDAAKSIVDKIVQGWLRSAGLIQEILHD